MQLTIADLYPETTSLSFSQLIELIRKQDTEIQCINKDLDDLEKEVDDANYERKRLNLAVLAAIQDLDDIADNIKNQNTVKKINAVIQKLKAELS